MNADIIFESEISDISTKLKKKINITSSHQSETHYVYAQTTEMETRPTP